MPITEHGIFYPTAADHTRLWEHFQQNAETTDAAIGLLMEQVFGIPNPLLQWGYFTRTITGNNQVSDSVTFARRYADTPVVQMRLNNASSGWAQWLTTASPTSTGFTWTLQTKDNQSTELRSGRIGWFAIGAGEEGG